MLRVFPNTAKATVTHTSIHGFTCRADVSNMSHVSAEADSVLGEQLKTWACLRTCMCTLAGTCQVKSSDGVYCHMLNYEFIEIESNSLKFGEMRLIAFLPRFI